MDNAWITTSPSMPNDTAVIENHDRLFASHVLGVPRESNGNASKQRWVDNYAFRLGAAVTLRAFRFGGEGDGMGGVWNFAPFACQLVQSPYSHLDLCARVPHDAPSLPPDVHTVPSTAVTIEDSELDVHDNGVLTLVEVPSVISLRGSELKYLQHPVLALDNGTDLRSPAFAAMFARAAADPVPLLRYDLTSASNWDGPPHPRQQLPPEMLPFSVREETAEAPPARGVWAAGARLRAATPTRELAGWICTEGGTPGSWEPFGLAAASAC